LLVRCIVLTVASFAALAAATLLHPHIPTLHLGMNADIQTLVQHRLYFPSICKSVAYRIIEIEILDF
jgi:hypothetical protein